MYAITTNSKLPIFQINTHIGYDDDSLGENGEVLCKGDGQGIDGRLFSKEFYEQDGYSPDLITIYVNSMGGDVQQSLDMFTAIVRAKSRTKSVISGFAYSCSGWLPLAADIVEMTTASRWMCHMPYNPKRESERSAFLDSVSDIIATTIADKSGRNNKPKKTKEEILELMKCSTYFTAEQMLENGLIDKMTSPSGKTIKVVEPEKYNIMNFVEIKSYYKENQKALNYFLQTIKNDKVMFPKVVNRINENKVVNVALTADAGEDAVVDAISRIENKFNAVNIEKAELEVKVNALNKSGEDLQERMKAMQSKIKNDEDMMASDKIAMDKMKQEYENMTAENKLMKDKIKAQEDNAAAEAINIAKEKATNLVKLHSHKFSASNKSELDSTIKVWEDMAAENFERTKVQLEAIAVNMKTPTPVFNSNGEDNRPDAGDGSAAYYRAMNKKIREEKAASLRLSTGRE